MAVQTNTFKGARYVPKFADPIEWSADNSYEAIESVQHNGFTYLSKQPVPAGVQIDNEDFWLRWADPNAQMEQLRQEVGQYAGNVEKLSGVVGQWGDELAAEIEARKEIDATKATVFNTVSEMKNSANLEVGEVCHTNGFYNANDGGTAWYIISDSGVANEMDVIACGNLFARLIEESTIANVLQYGCIPNDPNIDCSEYINYITENHVIKLPAGKFYAKSPIYIKNSISGDGYNKLWENNGTQIVSVIDTANYNVGVVNLTTPASGINSIYIKDISIKCNTNEAGLYINKQVNDFNTYVEGVACYNCRRYGIYHNSVNPESRAIQINNCSVWHETNDVVNTYNNSVGFYINNDTDCKVTNCESMGFKTGFYFTSFVMISNCHSWCGAHALRDNLELWKNSVAFRFATAVCSELYADTAFVALQAARTVCVNNFYYYEDSNIEGFSEERNILFAESPGGRINMLNGEIHDVYNTFAGLGTKDTNKYLLNNVYLFTNNTFEDMSAISTQIPEPYLLNTSPNGYCEVAAIQTRGYAEIDITSNAGWNSKVKIRFNQNQVQSAIREGMAGNLINVWYKVVNGVCKFYVNTTDGQNSEINVTPVVIGSSMRFNNYTLRRKLNGTLQDLELLTTTDGLTLIPTA